MHLAPTRKKRPLDVPPEERCFGRQITADHLVLREGDRGKDGERYVVVALDRDTQWLWAFPVVDKSCAEAVNALLAFVGPKDRV